MNKKIISVFLIMLFILNLMPLSSSAATKVFDTKSAIALSKLGLFEGGNTGFALERPATRAECAALLIRLLGLEREVESHKWSHPFTDVPDWASSYVGKLYQLKYTTGKTATTYGSKNMVSAKEFAVFIMRSLGYVEGIDFTWNTVFEKAAALGVYTNLDLARYQSGEQILRGDIVNIMSRVLRFRLKSSNRTLLDILVLNKLVNLDAAEVWLAGQIADEIRPELHSEYDKALASHNLVVNKATYGYLPEKLDPDKVFSRSAYGVLSLGGGVCGSYAEAYQLMGSSLGLNVRTITGTAYGVSGWNAHAWNLTDIDGKWYHVDTTFDDPVGVNVLRFNYFNVTDKEIAVDHRWNVSDYPACTATDANYFVRNSGVVGSASEFKSSILSGVNQRVSSMEIKVSNYQDSLYGNDVIFGVMKSSGIVLGYSRTVDEKMGVIRLTNIRYVN